MESWTSLIDKYNNSTVPAELEGGCKLTRIYLRQYLTIFQNYPYYSNY